MVIFVTTFKQEVNVLVDIAINGLSWVLKEE